MLKIVNIVPVTQSSETQVDSEPDLAVNPANTQQLAATAFTRNENTTGNQNAPIYVSQDGGSTWELRRIIPDDPVTADITVAFSLTTGVLFAAKIPPDKSGVLKVLSAANFLDPSEPAMQVLDQRTDVDQPWIMAATVAAGPGAGADRLYVGFNHTAPPAAGSSIDSCLDAGAAPPAFTVTALEQRIKVQDLATRLAIHSSGTIYAVYYRWRTLLPPSPPPPAPPLPQQVVTGDVVVARDDNWGTGSAPFTALLDPRDQTAGLMMATCINLVSPLNIGGQRAEGHLSIAVDPNDSATVYLAWAELAGPGYVLHLQQSNDSGQTWSDDLLPFAPGLTFVNVINPSVAVNDLGEVGLSYQLLTGTSPNDRWQTHLMISPRPGPQASHGLQPPGFFPLDVVLADTPTVHSALTTNPLGDYDNLMAVGPTFFGIFSALNTPDMANFPQGVSYQRNADFGSHQLLDQVGTPSVSPSVDPFFFQIAVPLRQPRPGIPVPDFDGDGRTDLALWRPSDGTWNVIASSTGQPLPVQQWGTLGDIPVPGDYDGDGTTDFAVWRPSDGTWNVIASSTGQPMPVQPWGMAGDVPVTGDYNGDGMTDLAVWRPSEVSWHVMASSTGAQLTQQLGMLSDIPL